jgi:hypothetical protein
MKNPKLIFALLLVLAITSCKKEKIQQTSSNPTKPAVVAAVRDSVSYTVDGQIYNAAVDIFNPSAGIEDANRKLIFADSTNKYAYSLIGKGDSIMYFQKNTFISKSANINIFFLKKFAKPKRPNGNPYPGINDVLSIFTVGKYPLAEDFEWQNSQNGIAIDISANNKGYSSYNSYNGISTVVLQPGFQKNFSFEIVNFTKATSGGYNLEAKFTAAVFDANGVQKKLDNGYLSLHFGPIYAEEAN